MTLRICFAISSFGQGGAQKQCVALMNKLSLLPDVTIDLIHFEGGVNFDAIATDRIRVTRIPSRSQYDPLNIFRMARFLRKSQPDLLFSWLHAADVFSALARKAAPKTKWVLAERDSCYPDNWRYNLRRWLGRNADRIICNSEKGKQYWIEHGLQEQQTSVISNINLASAEKHTAMAPAPQRAIIYAGRLEPQKDIIRLAFAFKDAAKRSEVQFKIIGDGTLAPQAREIAQQSGCLNFSVSSYDPKIFEIYSSKPIYVTLSLHEGTPNAVIENIAFGNIIVASRIPEHVDLLGADYPFYVDPHDNAEQIASTILLAYNAVNKDALAFARKKVSQMTPSVVAKQYLSLFKEVVAQ